MDRLLQAILADPSSFDDIAYLLDTDAVTNSYYTSGAIDLWHRCNRQNGLRVGPSSKEEHMRDALFGSSARTGTQVAHVLPRSTSKNPAAWLFIRAIGLAPWGPSTTKKVHRDGIGNTVPLPYQIHQLWDAGRGEFQLLPAAQTLEAIILKIEADLAREERYPSMRIHDHRLHWHWDLTRIRFDESAAIGPNILFAYRPTVMTMDRCRAPGVLVYEHTSPSGEHGTRCVSITDDVALLPVQYGPMFVRGWRPPDEEGSGLLAVKLPISPISTLLADHLATVESCASWSNCTTTEYARLAQLRKYILSLLAVATPSSWRRLDRPSGLGNLPTEPFAQSNLPRLLLFEEPTWWNEREPHRTTAQQSDSSSSAGGTGPNSRWLQFVQHWLGAPTQTSVTPDFDSMDADSLSGQLQRIEAALSLSNYGSEGLSAAVFQDINADVHEHLCMEVQAKGLGPLLELSNSLVPGLSEWTAFIRRIGREAEQMRQLQLALQHLEFYLEWVECSAFPRPERGVSGSETPHVPTNTPAEVC